MCLVHVQSQQSSQSKHGKKFLLRLCLMEPRFVPNSLRSRKWSWTSGPPSKCRDCRRGSPHPVYTTISTVPLLTLLLPLQLLECVNGCPCHGLLLLIIHRISRSPSLPHLCPHSPEHPAVITTRFHRWKDRIWAGWSALPWTRAGKPAPHPPLARAKRDHK